MKKADIISGEMYKKNEAGSKQSWSGWLASKFYNGTIGLIAPTTNEDTLEVSRKY